MTRKPETRLVHQILEVLRKRYPKGYLRKIHGDAFQHAGIPDIVGCIGGIFIGLEVKTDEGRTSKIQELEGQEIIDANGIYGVVTNHQEALNIILEGLRRFNITQTRSHKDARNIILEESSGPWNCDRCECVILKLGHLRGEGHVHHLDEDCFNNDRLNLVVRCVSCHIHSHAVQRYYEKGLNLKHPKVTIQSRSKEGHL